MGDGSAPLDIQDVFHMFKELAQIYISKHVESSLKKLQITIIDYVFELKSCSR